MDWFEASNRRREAQRRLWARRQRISRLRTRVVAISLIGFAMLWGIVFTQMATGNDPVLGPKAQATAQRQGHRRKPSKRSHKPVPAEPEEEEAPAEESEYAESEYAEPEYAGSEYAEPEPEYVEPEPEYVEPEPEYFEPEPVETTVS
jgi:cytoskeletal protein RodZ